MSKETNTKGEPKICITYWHIESRVSNGFNRLKAKLYNLVEASVVDQKQADAMKGLIKGFANDEFMSCIRDMRSDAIDMELINDPEGIMMSKIISAEPLENK